MIPTATTLKELVSRYPYHGLTSKLEDAQPGPFIGYYLSAILPSGLRDMGISADVADRFCLLAFNFNRPQLLYPFEHPRAAVVLIAKTAADYERLRYQKPTRITSFVREGKLDTYLDYFIHAKGGLLPLIAYLNIKTGTELADSLPAINRLLEERRPSVVVMPADQFTPAIERKVKSGLRAVITLSKSSALFKGGAYEAYAPKLSLDPSASIEGITSPTMVDTVLLFFGTGTACTSFSLDAPKVGNLPKWKAAFDHVQKQVIDSTLPFSQVTEHMKRVKEVLTDKGLLVPHLNRYPDAPPAVAELGNIALSHGLRVRTDAITDAFMRFDNTTLQAFNPVVGRPTGIIDTMLSRPSLLSMPVEETKHRLAAMGYNLDLPAQQVAHLNKQRDFYAMQIAPLKPISGLECLAYFQPASYPCKKSVLNPDGETIWKKGQHYRISPNWEKQSYPGGSEPIVGDDGKIEGTEEFTIRYSVLTLETETNQGSISIAENECRESVDEEHTRLVKEAGKDGDVQRGPWRPLLDEFLQAFEVPRVPTIMDLQPDRFAALHARLLARMPMLKAYQSEIAVLNAMKRGGILGSEMGAGKTYQAIGVMYLRGKAFNLIIVPPMLVPQWMKTLQDCNFWVRSLLTHAAVTKVQRHYKRLQGKTQAEKASIMFAPQEFYVTTPEFLSLGDQGNKVYNPWVAAHEQATGKYDPRKDGVPTEILELEGTRYHVTSEAQAMELSSHRSHQYGAHVKKCPKCAREHGMGFTDSGFCHCGYRAFSFVGHRQRVNAKGEGALGWILGNDAVDTEFQTVSVPIADVPARVRRTNTIVRTLGGKPVHLNPRAGDWEEIPGIRQKRHSDYFYPAYGRLGKIFGTKVIDEVHLIANLDSQKGAAVYSIYADETYVMSGTISRGYVTDIESALAHVHEPETPCFPFAPWDRKAFREQFITERVKISILDSGTKKTAVSMVPEASNVNRLRRMLNCVTTRADEATIEAEWKLPQPSRQYIEVKLTPANQDHYNKILRDVVTWYKYATKKDRHRNAMSKLWELRHICENQEKLECILGYARKWTLEGRKFVIVAPTKNLYRMIRDSLYALGIRTLAVDDTTPPERRQELTSRFEDPMYTALVSRTKLVCTGLNTLVHADRLIIAGGEYHPATVRQMEKRLIRPGQKSDYVEIIYPIVRMSPQASVEEEMLKLMLMKEASVNEVVKGQVRWIKPALLVESAMESKGAVRVLEALADKTTAKAALGDYDLDALFTELETKERAVTLRPLATSAIEGDELPDDDFISVKPVVLE